MKKIINAKIILKDKIVKGKTLIIKGERILDILKDEDAKNIEAKEIDANSAYLSAGFIDIHSDYIEQLASPRPSSLVDFNLALREAEKHLLSSGITTMFHSLSLLGGIDTERKIIRKEENLFKLMELVNDQSHTDHIIHHRMHLRVEINSVSRFNEIKKHIENGKVQLLSFMDHTPGQGQYTNLEKFKEITLGYNPNMTDEEFDEKIKTLKSQELLSEDEIDEIIALAKAKNISVASHDDDSPEKLNSLKKRGFSISEFPINLETAISAREEGLTVVMGAANVMLGGSHSGNLSAELAIKKDLVDVLCSDYYPSSILHSIFKLHFESGMDLAYLFNLVTRNPAIATNIIDDRGEIAVGKRADLIFIELKDEKIPLIKQVIVNGKKALEMNYR